MMRTIPALETASPLQEMQSQTQQELDALLPSVLDRAFKGQSCKEIDIVANQKKDKTVLIKVNNLDDAELAAIINKALDTLFEDTEDKPSKAAKIKDANPLGHKRRTTKVN